MALVVSVALMVVSAVKFREDLIIQQLSAS